MKTLRTLAVTVAMLLCYTVASAYDFEADGIYYRITNSSSLTVAVTYRTTAYNSYSGEVVIPATVTYNDTEYQVTSIDVSAFSDCSELAAVTIPESVTSIGSQAFQYCNSLSDLHLGSVESWANMAISEYDYTAHPNYYAKNIYVGDELVTEVVLPESMKSIPGYRFYNFTTLTSIVIPEGVPYVGYNAFKGCSSLVSVTIPESVTSIKSFAFKDCSSLTDITLPEGLTSIEGGVFSGCSSLTSITLPEEVTSINVYAFSGCSNLTSINIPEGVTSIDNDAFSGCSSLTNIYIASLESWLTIKYGNYRSHPNFESKNVKINIDGEELTEIEIPSSVTYIPQYAFSGCSSLTSITIPEGVTSIGEGAFSDCSSLTSMTIPASVTLIDYNAFNGCTGIKELTFADGSETLSLRSSFLDGRDYGLFYCCPLEKLYIGRNLSYDTNNSSSQAPFYNQKELISVTLSDDVTSIGDYAFSGCSSLTSITISDDVTSIGDYAFSGCSSLTAITIPEGVTSIGYAAFYYCSSLTSITIPESVTSVGHWAFDFCTSLEEIIWKPATPPTISSLWGSMVDYVSNTTFYVPLASYDDYISAWSYHANRITIDDINARVKNVALTAIKDMPALEVAIGEENLKYVTNLTISGSINSYDFMAMRNMMPLLRHLDLSEATIVYNEHEHYTGYHTEDNKFPGYGLYGCNLLSLVLPKGITTIGTCAMGGNTTLSEVTFFEGPTSIGSYAFKDCNRLTSIVLPAGLKTVGYESFRNCKNLHSVSFPEELESIGGNAFYNCYDLINVILPPTVKTIGDYAFYNCSNLTEIRIPSSIRSVGNYAFDGCSKLKDVYAYTVEPIDIDQKTFTSNGNNFIATLHAPKVSYRNYRYNTQWSQFASFAEFDEPYDNFYLVGDKVLDNNTGAIEGEEGDAPDAEMGDNSGIIVEDDVNQDLGDVDIEHNGSHGGSIIVGGNGCVNADKLHFHINVQGGRWYFFCFPFDVKREDIVLQNGAEWIFRYYDGKERAHHGKGGWKNMTSDGEGNFLKAATGYIFQCSKNDVLILTAKNQKIKHEHKYNELVAHVTQNAHDASWNFVGNPYLSYYELTANDYSAPITVWDGSKYIAIRPGDDDYQLAPFEAFFVQKPEGTANIEYNPEQQMTYHQSQEAAAKARARRRAMPVNPDRLIVNITLDDSTSTDQTRVVFNNEATMGYETACDAAKFESAGVAQLYTIDSRAVKYAINERPVAEGIVTLGYSIPVAGNYTLAAPRMDAHVYVKDNLTGTIHDFAEGSYDFASEAGTFDDRFVVMMKAGETGIDKLETTDNGQQSTVIYDAVGRRVEKMEQGIYIKENRKVVKL